MNTRRLLLICCLVALSAGAGTKVSSQNGSPSPRCPQTVKVTIKNFKYGDGNAIKIDPGDSIVWFNADDMPHTASSVEESPQAFDTGILKPGEASAPIIFLKSSGAAGFSYSCNIHSGMSGNIVVSDLPPDPDVSHCHAHETPSEHSMVVTGRDPQSIFLHHIALFGDTNHFYHVTLEAKLEDPAAQDAYRTYRKDNGDSLCILDPELFLLPEIDAGTRTSFMATFNNGKWQGKIKGLIGVKVTIVRKIQFRRFDPNATYPDRLTYQLYGNDKEVFLAHQVTAAPSFQEVIKLKEIPAGLTKELIQSSPLLIVPAKQLAASGSPPIKTAMLSTGTHILLSPPTGALSPEEPLQENEELAVQIAGKGTIKLTVGKLIYFDTRIINK